MGRRVAKQCVVVLMAASLVRCGGRDATHHDATSGTSGSSGVGGSAGANGGEAGMSRGGTAGSASGSAGSSGDEAGTGGSSGAGAGTGGSSGAEAGSGGAAGAGAGTGGSGGAGADAGGSAGAGTGGSGGAGAGAGGSGGGPIDSVPDCVRALMVPCPYEGECLSALNDQQKVARMCIENGTVAVLDYSNDGGACTPGDTITTNVYASDGSLCYKTVRTMGAGCESSSGVWFDHVGNQIATESVSYPTNNVTLVCTEGGESATCSSPCYSLRPSCTTGNCPNPR